MTNELKLFNQLLIAHSDALKVKERSLIDV